MEIMDIGEGEEELVVGIGKVANVERAKLHGSRSKKAISRCKSRRATTTITFSMLP